MPSTIDDPLVLVDDPNVSISGDVLFPTQFIFGAAGDTAGRLWESLGRGFIQEDETLGYPLLWYLYCGAVGLQTVDLLVRDTDAGPGWQQVLDVNVADEDILPFLGQFIGASLTPGLTVAQWRDEIKHVKGWRRGSPTAIIEAVKTTLIGNRTVILQERFEGDPYSFRVETYVAETPYPAYTQSVIQREKPAGLITSTTVNTSGSYQKLKDAFATYEDVRFAFASYGVLRVWQPPV